MPLPAPAAYGVADRRVPDYFGPAKQTEDQKDLPTRREQRMLQRDAAWRELNKVLGATLARATHLLVPGAAPLGPARDREGKILCWSYWSPSRRVLIDRFKRSLPSPEELEDREAFARENGIRYAVVAPGASLTARDVAEWLENAEEKK
jgi:hypothetical protein